MTYSWMLIGFLLVSTGFSDALPNRLDKRETNLDGFLSEALSNMMKTLSMKIPTITITKRICLPVQFSTYPNATVRNCTARRSMAIHRKYFALLFYIQLLPSVTNTLYSSTGTQSLYWSGINLIC